LNPGNRALTHQAEFPEDKFQRKPLRGSLPVFFIAGLKTGKRNLGKLFIYVEDTGCGRDGFKLDIYHLFFTGGSPTYTNSPCLRGGFSPLPLFRYYRDMRDRR